MKTALTLAALLVAGQAQALSCLRPDPATSFAIARDSATPYLVLTGDLTAPPASGTTEQTRESVLGTLTGKGLTADGFTADFQGEVILQATCAGPWCRPMPTSGPILVFARIDGPTPVIEVDACGSWLFSSPDQAMLDRLTTCMQGGDCSAQPVQ